MTREKYYFTTSGTHPDHKAVVNILDMPFEDILPGEEFITVVTDMHL